MICRLCQGEASSPIGEADFRHFGAFDCLPYNDVERELMAQVDDCGDEDLWSEIYAAAAEDAGRRVDPEAIDWLASLCERCQRRFLRSGRAISKTTVIAFLAAEVRLHASRAARGLPLVRCAALYKAGNYGRRCYLYAHREVARLQFCDPHAREYEAGRDLRLYNVTYPDLAPIDPLVASMKFALEIMPPEQRQALL